MSLRTLGDRPRLACDVSQDVAGMGARSLAFLLAILCLSAPACCQSDLKDLMMSNAKEGGLSDGQLAHIDTIFEKQAALVAMELAAEVPEAAGTKFCLPAFLTPAVRPVIPVLQVLPTTVRHCLLA